MSRASIDFMTKAERIVEQALDLGDDERLEVALALLDSMEAPDPHGQLSDEELAQELQRRADEVEAGTARLVSWEALRAQLERRRKR